MQKRQKEKIRLELLSLRDSMSEKEVSEKSSIICENLTAIPEIQSSKIIAAYFPIRNEVDIKPFIIWCIKKKKTVLLPVTKKDEIQFCKIDSLSNLKEGKFGIFEPKDKYSFDGEIDVILVPGVCFDEKMHRLGYGKGYYDKFLKNSSSYKIGICYAFQVVSELPIETFDVPLEEVVTEDIR
ncbi:MAG: 5-formyltetrahydrofolate cyclo-ligase [Candidatus Bilamarchaeum sp.]|jgi:5-formyltetrahydrofolate cyclo-ligase